MFQKLGIFVCRFWPWLLATWCAALVTFSLMAPEWRSVIKEGEFAFLPEDSPSRVGEDVFREAFPDDMRASTVVIVLRREHSSTGLVEADEEFIEQVLVPKIIEIAEADGGLADAEVDESESSDDGESGSDEDANESGSDDPSERSTIARVRSITDNDIGDLLRSSDNKAGLVLVELTTEFLEFTNKETIERIERLFDRDSDERLEIPPGLAISISGSATVGRDMIVAGIESADSTELWTVIMVMFLLIVIYRAPILAVIPLATVAFATQISISLLAILADAGVVNLFDGIEVYVTVLVYGAGVDYCLFLIARYKEELDAGATYDEAVANCLGKVGHAITASAGTVICGIGMMVFAEFGKFREAGVAITFSLVICLTAALTLTPCMLRLAHRWAFWPRMKTEKLAAKAGWISSSSMMARVMSRNWFTETWTVMGRVLERHPTRVWLISVLAMTPFAVIGVVFHSHLSYGLLAELPQEKASVVGANAVQAHFPAGYVDPVKVLIKAESADFTRTEGINSIRDLTLALRERMEELNIADVRAVSHPLGGEEGLDKYNAERGAAALMRGRQARRKSVKAYVSEQPGYEENTTRMEIVFQEDPFARNSIQQLSEFKREFRELLPEEIVGESTELHFIGATPSIFDLKRTTDRDQIRIDVLVLLGVYLILVILLRRPAISAYLIISVFFSYLATLGVTFVVFWSLDPAGFAGLDWKVPMFLFTILIAVGEDYNIFLMTRIEEEQAEHGVLSGITVALEKTGSIISSCGLIMAGTFSSLMFGTLVGLKQLGFALAFGVLLDTFVVRPILVPAYLILLHSGRLGRFGRYLGAGKPTEVEPQAEWD